MNKTKTIKELERDLENFKLLSKTYNEKLKVLDKKNKLNAILFVGLFISKTTIIILLLILNLSNLGIGIFLISYLSLTLVTLNTIGKSLHDMSEFDNIKINEELNKINILNTKELIDNYNEKVISEERIEEKKKNILAYKRYLNNQKQIEEKNNVKKLELRR